MQRQLQGSVSGGGTGSPWLCLRLFIIDATLWKVPPYPLPRAAGTCVQSWGCCFDSLRADMGTHPALGRENICMCPRVLRLLMEVFTWESFIACWLQKAPCHWIYSLSSSGDAFLILSDSDQQESQWNQCQQYARWWWTSLCSVRVLHGLFLHQLGLSCPTGEDRAELGQKTGGRKRWNSSFAIGHRLLLLGCFLTKGLSGCLHVSPALSAHCGHYLCVPNIRTELIPKPFAWSNENGRCWQLFHLMIQFSVVSQDFPSPSCKWLLEACPLALCSTANPISYLLPIPTSLFCFYLGDFCWRCMQLDCAISKFCKVDQWETIIWSISNPRTEGVGWGKGSKSPITLQKSWP